MNRAAKAILATAVAVAVLCGGIYLGGHPTYLPKPLRDLLVNDQVAVQAQVLKTVEDNFYKQVDGARLENGSLEGMVRGLDDRFSAYLDPFHARIFAARNDGKYSGVGITVTEDRRGLRITDVKQGSPAHAAGLRIGDVIQRVDGKSIAGKPTTLGTALIRGTAGTTVVLGVLQPRSGSVRTFKVKRANIDQPLVAGRVVNFRGKPYGAVGLAEFDVGAADQLSTEIDRLRKRGVQGVVLDLRGNPGGLINQAVDVASLFIKDGVVVVTKGRTQPRDVFRASGDAPFASLPLVVLVDRNTASSAEIVTGALQDHHRAEIVGTRTFGKGVFQQIFPLQNGGTLDLTVGHYYTPNGHDLGGRGVQPQVKAVDRRATRQNEALQAALRELSTK